MLRRYTEERPDFLHQTLRSFGLRFTDSEERKEEANVFIDNDVDR